jgi:serine/threonine protein kinase
LPKVSDHFTEDDTQYLIMEHIAGDDLAKRLEVSEKPFPVGWVLFWADQLLDALGYMHSQEPPVIHRDIKPQNLKLTAENTIILLDFGLSKNTPGETRKSTTNSVVGYTPHFAPMEQIRGIGTSPQSDIYSLSATLYQLLTNEVPPDVLARADELLSGKPDPIKPLYEINPEVSQELSDVILKGISVSLEQRFSDAREMQKSLREANAHLQSSKPTVAFNGQSRNEISEISQPQLKTNISVAPSHERSSVRSFTREGLSKAEKTFSQTPAQSLTRQKGSNRKRFAIVALSLSLVLLTAAGLGWFILFNSQAATRKNPTPTPEAAATTLPPPSEPTAESAANTDTNTANSNKDGSILNPDGNIENQTDDSVIQNSINKTAKPTQSTKAKPTPKATPRPRTTTKATPKPTPSSKATPLPRILP